MEKTVPTAWVPRSKPVVFTELGCAAVDKGPNQPNVFPDRKSSENAAPYFSNGGRSDMAQRRFLEAHYGFWTNAGETENPHSDIYGGRMLDPAAICLWAWDARPFPVFPIYGEVWSDGPNWRLGHWLGGRLSGVAAGDLIGAILADWGLPPAEIAGAEGTLSGYLIDGPQTARAAIEPIADLFGLAARETGGLLVFETEGRSAAAPQKLLELVIEDDNPVISRTRVPDNALPARVQLDFRDPLNDYQAATVEAVRSGAAGEGKRFASFPGVLSTGEAQALVSDWLRRKWAGREEVSFSLPMTAHAAEPGALVRLPGDNSDIDYLIETVETGLTCNVSARRIGRMAPAPQGGGIPFAASDGVFLGVRPMALLLDLPTTDVARRPEEQLRLATRAKPWRRQVALVSGEAGGFEMRAGIDRRATMGMLVEELAAEGFEGRLDRHSAIKVLLFDGELASVSRLQLLNGANAAAIRSNAGMWEIVQFESAEEVAASVWRLTGLLRGQLGTDDAMRAGADKGASFVLLDAAVQPAGLNASEIGLDLVWRIGPRGYDISDANFATVAATGGLRASLPLSPVHLRAVRSAAGLDISWIRRGRLNADSWQATEIPLGEDSEAYRIDVAATGGTAVRSVTTDKPRWSYAAGEMVSDFGQMPAAIDVTVRQMSQVAGPGLPATRRFEID